MKGNDRKNQKRQAAGASFQFFIGRGIYSIPEAARIIRLQVPDVTPRKVRRWVDGYLYHDQAGDVHESPSVIYREPPLGPGDPLTFVDVIQLAFVAMFRSDHLSMLTIRQAAEMAARMLGSSVPFAMERFRTDGQQIFVDLKAVDPPEGMSRERYLVELSAGQAVLRDLAEPYLKHVEWENKIAARYWPLGVRRRVVIDPERSFGRSIDAPSGVPTYVLFQASLSGEPDHEIAAWYDVPVQAIKDAVEYERLLAAA